MYICGESYLCCSIFQRIHIWALFDPVVYKPLFQFLLFFICVRKIISLFPLLKVLTMYWGVHIFTLCIIFIVCYYQTVFSTTEKKNLTLECYALNSFYSKWGREISREGITGEWIAATFCLNCAHAKFLPRTGFDPFHGQLEYVFIES